MASGPVFKITYWGTTGTLTAPLRPAEVTEKLVGALRLLVEGGHLASLRPGPALEADLRRTVEAILPFHLRSSYGGNTTCVEVQTPDALLIFDGGSGLRELGVSLEERWSAQGATAPRAAHVLVTHPHMDHVFATPYFAPYFNPANQIFIYGSQLVLNSLEVVLNPQSTLSKVYFPPTFDQMKAIRELRLLQAGCEFTIGSTRIATFALNHPGGCLAYRLENAGRVFVFATDHEQFEVPDRKLAAFVQGADLLYTEGQYTQAEYDGLEGISGDPPLPRRGWGHSSVEACTATAAFAGIRALHLGHRDPRRSDEQISRVEAHARDCLRQDLLRLGRPEESCQVLIPYEGMSICL